MVAYNSTSSGKVLMLQTPLTFCSSTREILFPNASSRLPYLDQYGLKHHFHAIFSWMRLYDQFVKFVTNWRINFSLNNSPSLCR